MIQTGRESGENTPNRAEEAPENSLNLPPFDRKILKGEDSTILTAKTYYNPQNSTLNLFEGFIESDLKPLFILTNKLIKAGKGVIYA